MKLNWLNLWLKKCLLSNRLLERLPIVDGMSFVRRVNCANLNFGEVLKAVLTLHGGQGRG